MKKVILFGATGNLGKEIAKELVSLGYDLTVVVRSEAKGKSFAEITNNYFVADVCDRHTLAGIFEKQEIVISALGKSVSPNDRTKPSFRDVDFAANSNILTEAKKAGIKKFVYVSAFHSEKYQHLEYFKVHHDFSELLQHSGMDYTIVKPPALFSAFTDMFDMAKKGMLISIGKGDKKTNPIYEGDLAKLIVDSMHEPNTIIEAGGKTIYTRKQLLEIIQHTINKNKKVRTVPIGLFKVLLPLLKLVDKNTYDKFAFFIAVMQHDTVAPAIGEMTFEAYMNQNFKE
jgi:uncharacterized protein YbjT (DUF2867 family)